MGREIHSVSILNKFRQIEKNETFDWYQTFSGVKDIITQHISKTDKILNIGCGNSRLSEEMYDENYQNIVNVDISHSVIKYMEDKLKTKCPNMTYKQMDCLNMKEFQNGEFNVVLDKGTLDTILCGDNSEDNVEKLLMEINRVLKPNGVYICISYGNEEQRKDFLKNRTINFWDIKVDRIAKPSVILSGKINDEKDPKNYHYVYTMNKLA